MFPAHHDVPRRGIKANIWSSLPLIRWPFKRLPWLSCTLVTYFQWSCSVSPVKSGGPERQRVFSAVKHEGSLILNVYKKKEKRVSLVNQTICWIQTSSLLLFFCFHHALSLNYSVALAPKSQLCQKSFIHTPSFSFSRGCKVYRVYKACVILYPSTWLSPRTSLSKVSGILPQAHWFIMKTQMSENRSQIYSWVFVFFCKCNSNSTWGLFLFSAAGWYALPIISGSKTCAAHEMDSE